MTKGKILFHVLLFLFMILNSQGLAQEQLLQTVRGQVIDKETQIPLPGVNIVLLDSAKTKGTISDEQGYFTLKGIPVGRQSFQVSFIGYQTTVLENIIISSAKESYLHIELEEKITNLEEVVVKADIRKDIPVNKMAMISARSFTLEEASRYPGSYGDPARMAANFAGVLSARDNRNDVIIRGNSSTGLLWQLDDIEIPNPNHFAASGTSGGPITILNSNLLTNSDFLTGAFPAEYGNALAGVFDLKMRNGNNYKREYWSQMGYNGLEFGTEGPIIKGKRASYLIAYRYSFVDLLDLLGANVETTKYQDLNVKLNFPFKNSRLSLYGIGGKSYIEMFDSNDDRKDWTYGAWGEDLSNGSDLGVLAAVYQHFISNKTRIKIRLSSLGTQLTTRLDTFSLWNPEPHIWAGEKTTEIKYTAATQMNSKINNRNNLTLGLQMNKYRLSYADSSFQGGFYQIDTDVKKENLDLLQAFIQLKHKFSGNTEAYTGVHSQYLLFNKSISVEPRLAFRWDITDKWNVNTGYGLHAQMQPKMMYFVQSQAANGELIYSNRDMDFSKSHHFVVGTNYRYDKNHRLKIESYYQHLFDIPVKESKPSYSILNHGAEYFVEREDSLLNKGTGTNMGIELTLERFLSNNFYYLITMSLYESTYEGYDGKTRNTAFNGKYAINALCGYELTIKKNNFLIMGLRGTYSGGRPYTPFSIQESVNQHMEVFDYENAYEMRKDDYFRLNFRIGFRRNARKFTMEYGMDIQYRTNYTNVFERRIDYITGEVRDYQEMGLYPMGTWRIQF